MKKSELLFTVIKPPLDFLALMCAALLAYGIRYLHAIQEIRPVFFNLPFKNYFILALIASAVWIFIFIMLGLYNVRGISKLREEVSRVFVGCLAGLAVILGIMVFSRYLFDSRFIIILGWGLAFTFVVANRMMIKMVQRLSYRFGYGIHRVAIVGSGTLASDLKNYFNRNSSLGYRVIHNFDQINEDTIKTIKEMKINDKLDEILQINPNQNTQQTISILEVVNDYHLDYKYTADLVGTQLTNSVISTFAGTPIIEVRPTRLDGWGRIYKRVFDIVVSAICIFVFSPLMAVCAIIIKLTSEGSIFFTYQRIGQFGKPFMYFKFRSMVKNAHQLRYDQNFVSKNENLRNGSPMIKFKSDPRITPFGKFMRRFSIDELPELFLVLRGKMSLVGPRPHEIEEVNKYQHHHKKLLKIKPGMTGLAQVSGRSDLNFEEEVKLDTFYIENWSPSFDLQILFRTPLAVLKRRKTE